MSDKKHQPTMAWHPQNGESQIFNHPSEVPEGWLDTHPSNKPKAEKPAAGGKVELGMSKAEIVAALTAGGVEHDPKAKASDLHDVLRGAVEKVLAEAKIPYSPEAPTKELLTLLPE